MASIHRRTNKDGTQVWRIAYRQDGKLRWTPTIATGEGAVEMKGLIEKLGPEAALAILTRRTGRATTDKPLLRDYLTKHLAALEAHATPGTVADYKRMADRTWLPRLGNLPVDAITRDDVVGWVAWQRKQETHRSQRARERAAREDRPEPPVVTYSPKSIENAQRFLSTVLEAAKVEYSLPANPAKGVRLPSDHERAERVFLEPDEFTAIYDHIPDYWKPLVATMYGTGMRWGEATALQAGDIQINGPTGVITVSRSWKKGAIGVYLGSPKSKRGRRTITIAEPLTSLLREHMRGLAADDLVFTGKEGGRVQSQHFHPRVWRRAVSASGISKRPDLHSLRHSHASALILGGVPLTVVQRRLGHESVTTTSDIYGHLTPDAYAGAAAVSGASLAGALPQIEA